MLDNLQMIYRMVRNDAPKRAKALAASPVKSTVRAVSRSAMTPDVFMRGQLPALQGVLIDGAQAFSTFKNTLSGAKKSILLETFTFKDDATGREIADLLVKKRSQGVDIKVLLDTYGTATNLPDAPHLPLYQFLHENGVEVRLHNPEVFSLKEGMPLTHRKLTIVDNKRFLTGGMNISDRYSKEWHDTMIRVDGPSTREAVAAFNRNWTRAGGEALPLPTFNLADPRVKVVFNDPQAKEFGLTEAVFGELRQAKNQIRIMVPYLSDRKLMDELIAARQRGVRVEALLPKMNDEKVYGDLNNAIAQELLENGVKVKWYTGKDVPGLAKEHFSHTKAMILDQDTLIMGSANADSRSFNGNHELNVIIKDPHVVQDAKQRLWLADWTASKPANLEELQNASLSDKVKRGAWKLLSPLL